MAMMAFCQKFLHLLQRKFGRESNREQDNEKRDDLGEVEKKPFHLFGLPLELRQIIYYHALTVDKSTVSPRFLENQSHPGHIESQMTDRLISAI